MRYIIYGANRVAKDFIYIFSSKLQIVALVEDQVIPNSFKIEEVPIYDIKDLNNMLYDQVIICDYEKKKRAEKLSKIGLKYNVDFVYEEDFFQDLDEHKINPYKKPLIVWGAGGRGEKFYKSQNTQSIDFYVDNNINGFFFEYEIRKPEEVKEWNKYFVVVTPAKSEGITNWLINKGLNKYEDFCTMQEFMSIPSNMLRKTIFDKAYYSFACDTMRNHLEIHAEGRCDCCCTTFMDIAIGELNEKSVNDVWNGIKHKIAVLSAQNHTYSFCKKDICPLFAKKENDNYAIDLAEKYKLIEKTPKVLLAAYDNGCNLKCVTCRKDYITTTKEEQERNIGYAYKIRDNILENISFLIIAGSGEVFLNKSYKELYMSEKARHLKEIRFLSNGLLFNEITWNEFRKNNRAKVFLTVSVDAATKKTYEYIRRGGNFDILMKNMEFAGELRKRGELSYLRMNFVVQKENYNEMPQFVAWGKRIGCDEVFFTKILNWGTYTPDEFREISMMEEDGVTPKQELLRIMNDPNMAESIVNMGTIQFALNEITDNYIENYYMWEIGRTIGGVF